MILMIFPCNYFIDWHSCHPLAIEGAIYLVILPRDSPIHLAVTIWCNSWSLTFHNCAWCFLVYFQKTSWGIFSRRREIKATNDTITFMRFISGNCKKCCSVRIYAQRTEKASRVLLALSPRLTCTLLMVFRSNSGTSRFIFLSPERTSVLGTSSFLSLRQMHGDRRGQSQQTLRRNPVNLDISYALVFLW